MISSSGGCDGVKDILLTGSHNPLIIGEDAIQTLEIQSLNPIMSKCLGVKTSTRRIFR